MFGILEAVAVPHSGIFNSYEELFKELNDRMEKEGYKIVKARSHRGKVGGADVPGNDIVRCDLVCDRGGRPYRCMATKHKTTTKKTDCPWKAKAVHRKTMGGWVLTITCDQHNHEPGTPEPPTPEAASEDEEVPVAEGEDEGPQPDAETAAAFQVAGVSNSVLRLTGDTFHQFKSDYRKMSQPERFGVLSQLQLRIAAIYAVQNEELQRQKRQDAQDKRHRQIEDNKRQKQRARQRRQTDQQQQQQQQQQVSQQQTQQQPVQQQQVQHQSMQHVQAHQQVQQQLHLPQQTQQQHIQQSLQQGDPQSHSQAQAEAQAQALLQSQLYLPQNSQQTPVPLPNFRVPQFQHYAGPPKRMRGRPSQTSQQPQ